MSEKLQTKKPLLIRDLREGKFKNLPPEKFAGNVFMSGKRIYEVGNKMEWRRIKDPLRVKEFFLAAGLMKQM